MTVFSLVHADVSCYVHDVMEIKFASIHFFNFFVEFTLFQSLCKILNQDQ